jgi:acyl-CoA thioester hydrolase
MARTAESRFRVRYSETDQMGFAYYANYFVWMEMGRSDFCRQCGFSYAEMERETQTYLAVAEANCRYIAAARYDEELVIQTRLEHTRRRVLKFAYSILNASTGTLLAEGHTTHVPLSREGKPKSIPGDYFEKLM